MKYISDETMELIDFCKLQALEMVDACDDCDPPRKEKEGVVITSGSKETEIPLQHIAVFVKEDGSDKWMLGGGLIRYILAELNGEKRYISTDGITKEERG